MGRLGFRLATVQLEVRAPIAVTDEQAEEVIEDFDIHVDAVAQYLRDRLEKAMVKYGLSVEVVE